MESIWHQLLAEKISRRKLLWGTLGAAGALALPVNLRAGRSASVTEGPLQQARWGAGVPPFTPIPTSTEDQFLVPGGFRYDRLRTWGEEIAPGVPFGYSPDFTAYLPIDTPTGGTSSVDGLLWVNHEWPNPVLMYGWLGGAKTAAQIRMERESLGGSIMRVRRATDGRWAMVADPLNRRITGYTTCQLTGPVAGTAAVRGATQVQGSVGNCSGGVTPWGTVLTCEENVDEFAIPIDETGVGFGWDASYVKEHQGWVTEIDPFDPAFVPRKRTALGRFRHENVAIRVGADGRIAAYMGDDAQDSCVYKFVSAGRFVPGDRASNLRLLDSGTLYAADFANGRWLPLEYSRDANLRNVSLDGQRAYFAGQPNVLFDARIAALAVGGTPVDRPEDLEIHPLTGHVYISLTNNTRHGNFHGQIVRLTEEGNQPDALGFEWEFFAVGGRQSGFSSPDNLLFDPFGNLWMASDVTSAYVGTGIYEFQGNNSLFFFATEGPDAGKALHFASGPVQCELAGPYWTPDGSTLFLSVQHPGEESPSRENPTSHWPDGGSAVPRPAVMAITGFPGWGQQRFPYW